MWSNDGIVGAKNSILIVLVLVFESFPLFSGGGVNFIASVRSILY